jgi:hypothetical protein
MNRDYRLEKFYFDSEKESTSLADELCQKRYTDFHEIGSGGMKEVFEVFDNHGQRKVAYAKLTSGNDEKLTDAFIREARLTAQLEHPNIISVYDVGIDDSSPYFTMELKTGDTLGEVLKNEYELNYMLGVFIKICDAMSYAHSRKIIHLDLKPDNVQMGRFGEVMVCDWGLSKVIDDIDPETEELEKLNPEAFNTMTMHGHIRGTPGFMAPEQIQGDEKTFRTDVYSLGCILYTILAGRAPLKGELESVLKRTLTGDVKAPETFSKKDVPESLSAVALKAMNIEAQDRYSSVEELRREVQNFLNGYATEAEEAGPFKHLQLFILRNKVLTSVLTLAVLVIITVTVISFDQIKENKADENLRLLKVQKAETDKATKEFYREQLISNLQFFGVKFDADMLNSLKKSIGRLKNMQRLYPDFKDVNAPLGYLHFIKQDFEASEKYLRTFPGIYEYMLPFIKKYKPLKEDGELLKSEDFASLLKEIEPLKGLHFKLLFYNALRTKNIQGHMKAVQVVLKKMNPEWDEEIFEYSEENKSLTIGGSGLTHLLRLNIPFKAVHIDRIYLKSNDLKNLDGLDEIPLKELSIRMSGVTKIKEVHKLNLIILQKIFVDIDQFSEKDLATLPPSLGIRRSRSNRNK